MEEMETTDNDIPILLPLIWLIREGVSQEYGFGFIGNVFSANSEYLKPVWAILHKSHLLNE